MLKFTWPSFGYETYSFKLVSFVLLKACV